MSGDPPAEDRPPGTAGPDGDDWERIVAAIHDPIAIADERGVVLKANHAFRQRFAEGGGEVVGRRICDLLLDSTDPTHDELLAAYVTYETSALRVPGTFLVSQQPIELACGPSLVYHLTDLSALRAAEAAARQSEAQARQAQKMEAVGRLGAGVAHDFNNLLTTILCSADLLLTRVSGRADLFEPVEQIRTAAEHGAALVWRLLSFSRPSGRPETIDLGAHLSGSAKLLGQLIGEDVRMQVTTGARSARVRIDPTQLEQVLLNLVLNARDAMPGGGTLCLRTEPAPAGLGDQPAVALVVADTGQGMTEEVRAHAFEPFFTTKPEGQGTGLGLATVHGIVREAGGEVTITSEPGLGTEVRVVLPTVMELPAPARTRPAWPPRGGTGTVLLVEDEEGPRTALRAALGTLGYEVLEASDGPAALLAAERHASPIDVLLSDVVMPGMGGTELARVFRERYPATRVLLMSGYVSDATREVLAGRGMAEVRLVAKPLTLLQLDRYLSEVLGEGVAT